MYMFGHIRMTSIIYQREHKYYIQNICFSEQNNQACTQNLSIRHPPPPAPRVCACQQRRRQLTLELSLSSSGCRLSSNQPGRFFGCTGLWRVSAGSPYFFSSSSYIILNILMKNINMLINKPLRRTQNTTHSENSLAPITRERHLSRVSSTTIQ